MTRIRDVASRAVVPSTQDVAPEGDVAATTVLEPDRLQVDPPGDKKTRKSKPGVTLKKPEQKSTFIGSRTGVKMVTVQAVLDGLVGKSESERKRVLATYGLIEKNGQVWRKVHLNDPKSERYQLYRPGDLVRVIKPQ